MGWTPDSDQRAALIRARELANEMRDSGAAWKAIADRLTADGYPTMHGAPWTYQMVQRLVRNPPLPAELKTSYSTRHWRNVEKRGPAKLLKCVHCAEKGIDKQAHDWAHIHGTDPEDVMNYVPLCRKCHMAYDPGSGHRVPHTAEARAKMSKAQHQRYGTEDTPQPDKQPGSYSEGQRRAYAEGTRVGANTYQSGKTQCPQEHEYDEKNTYYAPDGTRGCKECRRENVRRWRREQKRKRVG
jgi:hypothetical protein